jgi:hypothetical protein
MRRVIVIALCFCVFSHQIAAQDAAESSAAADDSDAASAAAAAAAASASDSGRGSDINKRIIEEHPEAEKPFEFPQWARDIRRADIIAFGVFPFTWFIASIIVDAERCSRLNPDLPSDQFVSTFFSRYYTGIGTSGKAVPWGNDEYNKALLYAGILSVSVALTEFIIIKIQRSKSSKKNKARQAVDSKIIRTPLSEINYISPSSPTTNAGAAK